MEDNIAARLSVALRFLTGWTNMADDPTLPRDTARKLRSDATNGERKLWSQLRKKQLNGFQFRRQYSIGPFFVDFICLEANLVIEVDGSQHIEQEKQDERRSAFLRANGFRVLRFWNFEVMRGVDSVVERISEVLSQTPRRARRQG